MRERLSVRCERLERDLAAAERELEQYRGGIEVARLRAELRERAEVLDLMMEELRACLLCGCRVPVVRRIEVKP